MPVANLSSILDRFDFMCSSSLFSDQERRRYGLIWKACCLLNDAERDLADQFAGIMQAKLASSLDRGGWLTLLQAEEVVETWNNLWDLLCRRMPELSSIDGPSALKDLLFANGSVSKTDGSIFRYSPESAPKLANDPNYSTPIDDVLDQRYDRQLGQMIVNSKKALSLASHPLKSDAIELMDSVVPNMDIGRGFTHFIRKELYKVQHFIDLKAKYYFDVTLGDYAPWAMKMSLLADDDLKTAIKTCFEKCSSTKVSDALFSYLFYVIIISSFNALLNFCISGSNLLPSEIHSIPLRSMLSSVSKK